jgi:hypothetical protein
MKKIFAAIFCLMIILAGIASLLNTLKQKAVNVAVNTVQDTYKEQLTVLGFQIESKENELARMEAEYTDSVARGETLRNQLQQLNAIITAKNELIELKNREIIALRNENLLLQHRILELQEQIFYLLQSCYAFEQLLYTLENEKLLNTRYLIKFVFNDIVLGLQMIPIGGAITEIPEIPSTAYSIFLGWTLTNDGELVDVTTLDITSDMVIYAKVQMRYDVTFIYEGQSYANGSYDHIVERGNTYAQLNSSTEQRAVPIPQNTDRKIFLGWAKMNNASVIVDPSSVVIYEHTTFVAVIETRYYVRYYVNGNLYNTQWVPHGQTSTPPSVNIVGYNFGGWRYNGAPTDNLSFEIYNDKDFIAIMTALTLQVHLPTALVIPPNTAQVNITAYILNAYPAINWNDVSSIEFAGNAVDNKYNKAFNGAARVILYSKTYTNDYIPLYSTTNNKTVSFNPRIENNQVSIYPFYEDYVYGYNSTGIVSHTYESGLYNGTITITDIQIKFKEY